MLHCLLCQLYIKMPWFLRFPAHEERKKKKSASVAKTLLESQSQHSAKQENKARRAASISTLKALTVMFLSLLSIPLTSQTRSQTGMQSSTLSLLQQRNLPIWCSDYQQWSAAPPTDFLLIKPHWTDRKQLCFSSPSFH